MNRGEFSRYKFNDDIPLAKRSGPIARPSRGASVLLVGVVIIMVSTLILLPRFATTNSSQVEKQIPASDGSLLGHYPYPEASASDLIEVYPGLRLHKDTYRALRLMRAAAAADGIQLVYLSGYRSISLQKEIFYGRKSERNQIAIERAKVSAPPGYSEHSTGYAIDLGDATRRDTDFEEDFELTKAFQWLRDNAARYHFILSFPRGNPQKVSYEPWHWRYEGTVEALKQFERTNKIRRDLNP